MEYLVSVRSMDDPDLIEYVLVPRNRRPGRLVPGSAGLGPNKERIQAARLLAGGRPRAEPPRRPPDDRQLAGPGRQAPSAGPGSPASTRRSTSPTPGPPASRALPPEELSGWLDSSMLAAPAFPVPEQVRHRDRPRAGPPGPAGGPPGRPALSPRARRRSAPLARGPRRPLPQGPARGVGDRALSGATGSASDRRLTAGAARRSRGRRGSRAGAGGPARRPWRASSGLRSASKARARPSRTSARSGRWSEAKERSAIAGFGAVQGQERQALAGSGPRGRRGSSSVAWSSRTRACSGWPRSSWSEATRTIAGDEAGSSSIDRK